jgi:hypothetical protein
MPDVKGVTLLFSNELAVMSPGLAEKPSLVAVVGFIVAVFALLMVGGAGPVYKLRLIDLNGAFVLIRWGAWIGLGAAAVALVLSLINISEPTRRVVISYAVLCV